MVGKDRISELPDVLIDHIMGFLPIQDAARTSVLSTVWRDAWLGLTQLKFDANFFNYISNKYIMASTMYVINKILMKHKGHIRKFDFRFHMFNLKRCALKSGWVELDEWLLFLTQSGIEEIHLSIGPTVYILPDCIFSCVTLKKLHITGVYVERMNSPPCIFPNLTSLCCQDVEFDHRFLLDSTIDLPNLKSLECEKISGFNITAPKLSSLKIGSKISHGCLLVNLDMRPIDHLHVYGISLKDLVDKLTAWRKESVALNVKHLKINLVIINDDEISAFICLLRMCPKLCKLDLCLPLNVKVVTAIDALMKHLEDIVAETFKTVRALNLSHTFRGSRPEMLLFKWLLSCFPMLEKVFIFQRKKFCFNTEFRNKRKLLRFLRASSKADIVYNYI